MLLSLSFILLFLPIFIGQKKSCCCTNIDFMSMEYTNILRCIAIFMVMMQHLAGFILDSRYFTPFGGGRSLYISYYKWIWPYKIFSEKWIKRFLEKKVFPGIFPMVFDLECYFINKS